MSYIITSISNEGGSPEQCYQKLKAASSGLADTYNLDMPSLLVGTLDSLMVSGYFFLHHTDIAFQSIDSI